MKAVGRWAAYLAAGLSAALGVILVRSSPFLVQPPSRVVRDRAALLLPGLNRSSERSLVVVLEPRVGTRGVLGLAVDQGPIGWFQADREGRILGTIPPAATPGARIDLFGSSTVIERIELRGDGTSWAPAVAFVTVLLVAVSTGSAPLALTAAALVTFAFTPVLRVLTMDAWLALPLLVWAAGAVLAHVSRESRIYYWKGTALLAALVFGAWVRAVFLPSAGSWDTEYWKAWTLRAASEGVTRVYGDADAVPDGHFWAQIRGTEPQWAVPYQGKTYNVDYPPLAMAIWRWSWESVLLLAPSLESGEARSAAVKLPAVLGDVATVAILLVSLGWTRRGLTLAALYWALPVSWLNSAVLGFLDGAYVPFAGASLLAAAAGRARAAGALLAVAALIKPQAILVVPAAAAALVSRRASLTKAALSGLAVTGAVLLPFLLAGTLEEAVVHVTRIVFQERLSGGFPNPWWVLGHIASGAPFSSPVDYVHVSALAFPARNVGGLLFLATAAFVFWASRGQSGSWRGAPPPRPMGSGLSRRAAALAGAVLVLAYGILGVGVHENHPHLLFFLLALTGLPGRRLALSAAGLSIVYVLNLLLLSGIGRFYGHRYPDMESLARAFAALRTSPGFDLTLVFAAVNTAIFISMLLRLRDDIRFTARGPTPAP